jgi:hypothetical protein
LSYTRISEPLPIADIDHAVVVIVLYVVDDPVAEELARAVHDGDAAIGARAFAVRHVDVVIGPVHEDAGRHEEGGGG